MKQPNPLVPQGSFEAHARGKSHVRIAVFTILAIHVVVLGALLIQGCKRDEKGTASAEPTNDFASTPPFSTAPEAVTPATSAPPVATTTPPVTPTPTSNLVAPFTPAVPTSAPVVPFTPTPPPATVDTSAPSTEHTIVKGDTFAKIAKDSGVTVKALQRENPGVDPARLKIGQKIKVPAKSTAASTGGTVATLASESNGDQYVVKSGDTLGKVATAHGTTVKAIQKLNNLTTTQIRVGQKLKMPARTAAPSKATPNPAAPGGTAPSGGFTPAPMPAQ